MLIDAINEVARERAQSFLAAANQDRIVAAYRGFADVPDFARVVTLDEVAKQNDSLSIPLYVKRTANGDGAAKPDERRLPELWAAWEQNGREFWLEMDALVETLDGGKP